MAVLVFRAGNTHTIKGVVCEMKRVPLAEMGGYIAEGWVTRTELLNAKPVKLSNSEVRESAEKAGIDGWDTKRFATLRKELSIE